LQDAIAAQLDEVAGSRSKHTVDQYASGLKMFAAHLEESQNIKLAESSLEDVDLAVAIESFIKWLNNNRSVSTERVYTAAVRGLAEYLVANDLAADVLLVRINRRLKRLVRPIKQQLPSHDETAMEKIIAAALELNPSESDNEIDRLIKLRTRALIVTLADTGMRIHEACKLKRGDMNFSVRKAHVIGKGGNENIVRFSERSLVCIKTYLDARQRIDGATGKQLRSLPVFARHDLGGHKKVKPLGTQTARKDFNRLAGHVLGEDAVAEVTPHDLRHRFVTRVARASNIETARALARHANISTTARYRYVTEVEQDAIYDQVFNLN
jgi:site-specific recombinase XerD